MYVNNITVNTSLNSLSQNTIIKILSYFSIVLDDNLSSYAKSNPLKFIESSIWIYKYL